jgi:hypothetical protein
MVRARWRIDGIIANAVPWRPSFTCYIPVKQTFDCCFLVFAGQDSIISVVVHQRLVYLRAIAYSFSQALLEKYCFVRL